MDVELIEIRDFLAKIHPFDMLPEEALDALPQRCHVKYARRGSLILKSKEGVDYLYIVRTGAVETHAPDGQLLARLGEGDVFGVHGLLNARSGINNTSAIEDTLLYLIPAEEFERLKKNYQQFNYFFAPLGAQRLRSATLATGNDQQLSLLTQRTSEMLVRDPITINPTASIQDAAKIMAAERISCVPIVENENLVGIFTDRDLCSRVVAKGLSYETPLEQVMTRNPVTLGTDEYAFDALLTMTQNNIRHLPIVEDGKIKGVITNTTLVRNQTTSAVYMVGDISKRRTFKGLAEVVSQIPNLLATLVEAEAAAHIIGHIVTSISDSSTRRLLELGEEKLGPPPIPYLWLASGSQARHEQTGVSDQDNCIILHDDYNEAEHGDYFKELAQFVCDGLNACGYVYCPGEMMAVTDKWRKPLSEWRKYFTKWIEEPEPMALMLSCIFFDLRPVRGDQSLYADLHALILDKAKSNRIFIAHMVGNALKHTPPLGFFRNFVLIKGGENDHQFDLKHTGVVPIVDIARIYALEGGITAVNTHERLMVESQGALLSGSGAKDLLSAYEFIAGTRLKHQARQIRDGESPDNYMSPEDLSHFERNHLRDAFSVVKTIQSAMAQSFNVGG